MGTLSIPFVFKIRILLFSKKLKRITQQEKFSCVTARGVPPTILSGGRGYPHPVSTVLSRGCPCPVWRGGGVTPVLSRGCQLSGLGISRPVLAGVAPPLRGPTNKLKTLPSLVLRTRAVIITEINLVSFQKVWTLSCTFLCVSENIETVNVITQKGSKRSRS